MTETKSPVSWIIPVADTSSEELQTMSALVEVMEKLGHDDVTADRIARWFADKYGIQEPIP